MNLSETSMSFKSAGLRDVFEAPGEIGFTYWAYATQDGIGEVLGPNYFADLGRVARPGDMVLVGIQSRASNSAWDPGQPETRRVLLMVTVADKGGRVAVRVVQDYGTIADPDAALTPEAAAGVVEEAERRRAREERRESRAREARAAARG